MHGAVGNAATTPHFAPALNKITNKNTIHCTHSLVCEATNPRARATYYSDFFVIRPAGDVVFTHGCGFLGL